MNKIRDFMRDRGVLLVLAACVVCAVGVGVWAVRTLRGQLQQNQGDMGGRAGVEDYPGTETELGGEDEWTVQPGLDVAGKVDGVPKATAAPSPSAKPSGSASRSGSSSRSGAAAAPPAASPVPPTPAYTLPVSGRLVQRFSGDELVYNETLGDWRTHNGADYACTAGAAVFAPVSGTVQRVTAGSNWGGVVEIAAQDGTLWRVCGVDGATVAEGDKVRAGSQIGTAGTVPAESLLGDHVHLEVVQGGVCRDPASFLN